MFNARIEAERLAYEKTVAERMQAVRFSRQAARHSEAKIEAILDGLTLGRGRGRDHELRAIEDTYYPGDTKHPIHTRIDRRH